MIYETVQSEKGNLKNKVEADPVPSTELSNIPAATTPNTININEIDASAVPPKEN